MSDNQPQPKLAELYNKLGSEAFSRLIYIERTILGVDALRHLTILPEDPHYSVRLYPIYL